MFSESGIEDEKEYKLKPCGYCVFIDAVFLVCLVIIGLLMWGGL